MIAALAAAALACGPPHAATLAHDAEARVYERHGVVYGCHRGRRRVRDLGPRAAILAVKLAGRHVAVRRARPPRDEEIDTYDLRSGRVTARFRLHGRIGVFRIDRNGVALYTAAPTAGDPWIRSNTAFRLGGGGIDPGFLGYASATVAFRDAFGIHAWHVFGGAMNPGTLARSGAIRVTAVRHELEIHSPTYSHRLGWPFRDCVGSDGCDGIDTLQIAGRYVGVHYTAFDRYGDTGGTLTIHDTATGRRARPCGASRAYTDHVETFVLIDSGAAACIRVLNEIPYVVSNGVVLDSGAGVDVDSLFRRGDQLVWRHDGSERTAPLPTASG